MIGNQLKSARMYYNFQSNQPENKTCAKLH
jgi:hypothetical protein